jgi:hypothetical protein
MVLNPSVFWKARQEMDSVVGQDRLPNFSDKGRLPYLDCIVQETLRWADDSSLTRISLQTSIIDGIRQRQEVFRISQQKMTSITECSYQKIPSSL